MGSFDLVLDPRIRDYVLFPIMLLMLLTNIFRHYLMLYIGNPEKKSDIKAIYSACVWLPLLPLWALGHFNLLPFCILSQVLTRTRRLRAAAQRIPEEGFLKRKTYFVQKDSGLLVQEQLQTTQPDNPMAAMANNPMMDQGNMMSMMSKNFATVISNILLFTWIDRSFSGFISVKLPFGLTRGFKTMFQSGIDLPSLDVSYVSSMSWYILNVTGLQGIQALILGQASVEDAAMQMSGMPLPQQQQAAPPSAKMYASEKDFIDLIHHNSDLRHVEARLLRKFTVTH